jgi:excisionase family DNA binding protein
VNDLRTLFAPDVVEAIENLVDERVDAALAEHGNGARSSPWLTIPESAEYLRTSERTIHRLVRKERIRSITIGRRRLLHRDDLDVYATTGEDVAPTTSPRRRRPSLDPVSPEA